LLDSLLQEMNSVPTYAVVLAVVAVVIVAGLLLSLLYYWRKRTGGRMLHQETPVLDTEQLREAHPAEQGGAHVHLPDITINSAKVNINPKPSPSIFARGNLVMEVLGDDNVVKSKSDEDQALDSSKQSTPVRDRTDIAILIERSVTPIDDDYGTCTLGYLSTRHCTLADASTAGLRGSWYSASEKGSYFSFSEGLEEDISQEVQICVDPVSSGHQLRTDAVEEGMEAKSSALIDADEQSYEVNTENENISSVCPHTESEIVLSIENENYVDEVYDTLERVENVEPEETKQECSSIDEVPQHKSPCLPIGIKISDIPNINIEPTSDQKPCSPLTHVSQLSTSTTSLKPLVSMRTLPVTESALSVSCEQLTRSGSGATLPSTPLTGASGYTPVYKEMGSSVKMSML